MTEERIVFITNKGKKYHFNPSCGYLKGKEINSIPFDRAKHSKDNVCRSCFKLLIENRDNSKSFFDEELRESTNSASSQNKKNNSKKLKNSIKDQNKLNLNNYDDNIDNFQNEMHNSDEEEDKIYSNNKKSTKNENNNINLNNNNIPFMDNDLSNIMPNSDHYDMINIDTSDSYNKKKKNNKKYNFKNIEEINFKEKEKKIDINEENNINNQNNIDEEKKEEIKIKNNNPSGGRGVKKNNIYKEEENNSSQNFIDSFEIQDEPLNNIKNLQENLSAKNNGYIKYKINIDKNILKILQQTNLSAKILYLKNLIKINDNQDWNISILSEKKNNINENTNLSNKGNFKFKYEITPIKNIVEPFKISVGFEIDYIDNDDINLINEENEKNYNKVKLDSLYETLSILRHFNIYKKTNKVHILINITEGFFFVIGENELQKIDKFQFSNNEIFYLRRFIGIQLNKIKDVRPIFKYNKKDLYIADIEINGNKLNNSQLISE